LNGVGGSGALSLRNKSKMIEILKYNNHINKNEKKENNLAEDVFFVKNLILMNSNSKNKNSSLIATEEVFHFFLCILKIRKNK
jgi:hypothetical protein